MRTYDVYSMTTVPQDRCIRVIGPSDTRRSPESTKETRRKCLVTFGPQNSAVSIKFFVDTSTHDTRGFMKAAANPASSLTILVFAPGTMSAQAS